MVLFILMTAVSLSGQVRIHGGQQVSLDTFSNVSVEYEDTSNPEDAQIVYEYARYQGMIRICSFGEDLVLDLNIWSGDTLVYSCSTGLYRTDFTITQVMVRDYLDMWESPLNGSTTMLAHVRRREFILHLLGKTYYFNN